MSSGPPPPHHFFDLTIRLISQKMFLSPAVTSVLQMIASMSIPVSQTTHLLCNFSVPAKWLQTQVTLTNVTASNSTAIPTCSVHSRHIPEELSLAQVAFPGRLALAKPAAAQGGRDWEGGQGSDHKNQQLINPTQQTNSWGTELTSYVNAMAASWRWKETPWDHIERNTSI